MVGTAGNGLHTMDRKKGTFNRLPFDLNHTEKLSAPPQKKNVRLDLNLFFICEDGSGKIWVGLSGGWITTYDLKTKRTRHINAIDDDKQSLERVSGALSSRDGIIWLTMDWHYFSVRPFPKSNSSCVRRKHSS